MKLLLFSDLHRNVEAARRLVERSRSADVIIGAGDFASARRGINECIDVLRAVQRPAVLVPGNNESYEELVQACSGWPGAQVLHGSGTTIQGITFFGLGGGVPVTPFGPWSYDLTEDQARVLLAACPAGCVLVSHSPPKGAVDVSANGRSLGSVAVREAIEQNHPALVVCGHVHESAGKQSRIGSSPVVNVGLKGLEWELSTG
jgi:Icc-related predicted phosphoesterase